MPLQDDEFLYNNAVQWINENPEDKCIPEEIKQDFLRFNTLPPENKVKLLISLNTLFKTTGLSLEIKQSLPGLMVDLETLPDELLLQIGAHVENESDISSLVATSQRMYSLFQSTRLLDKFLQRVAYGEQESAERLFTDVYQGNVEKIQTALRYKGRFTDYSGRTFYCTAYEYAYWAKDTHMCRMLERYMDDATKAQMLVCVNEIERIDEVTNQPAGLNYQQNGAEHRSAHFDLTPLISALQKYVNGYDAWVATNNEAAIKDAWMQVSMAQRDVPAHVAQEYCRPDRTFTPLPSFNVDREDIPRETLPRVLAFCNFNNGHNDLWFPRGLADSDLGFDFVVIRWGLAGGGAVCGGIQVAVDLAALCRLDEVRTIDLTLSRSNLTPQVNPDLSVVSR